MDPFSSPMDVLSELSSASQYTLLVRTVHSSQRLKFLSHHPLSLLIYGCQLGLVVRMGMVAVYRLLAGPRELKAKAVWFPLPASL